MAYSAPFSGHLAGKEAWRDEDLSIRASGPVSGRSDCGEGRRPCLGDPELQLLKATRKEEIMETTEQSDHRTNRRSFLVKGAALGAGTLGAGRLLTDPSPAFASGGLTKGDAAILRFLAAAEIIETDIWQQYNELAGIQDKEVPGGSGNPDYTDAVTILDSDMAQYIHDNTDDEITHELFLNAYLVAHGADPADLEQFRTLPSSKATGAQQIGRLTNLMQ